MLKTICTMLTGGLLIYCFSVRTFGSEIKKTETKTFEMTPGGYISVEGDEGFIRVSSWDKSKVYLVMTRRAWGRSKQEAERLLEKIDVRINNFNNRLEIKLVKLKEGKDFSFWDLLDPDNWGKNGRSATVDFELTVPKEINLNLLNDEGDVEVKSVSGDVEIHVDEGNIQIMDIELSVMNLYMDEGDINGANLNNPNGHITVEVDEGDITLADVNVKRLKTNSDEGDINIKKLTCQSCNISTDEGDVELEISPAENERYHISTDEGILIFYLPHSPDIRLDLEVEDGRIKSEYNISITQRNGSQRCRDKLGNGSSFLEASADEGTIFLRKQ